jgi:N-acetylmuramoyl-L-alanine amidase
MAKKEFSFSRRQFLTVVGASVVSMTLFSKNAFAATNTLRAIRTGKQPDDKTRLVIETSSKPSYSLSYPNGGLQIKISGARGQPSPEMVSGTLISSVAATQAGGNVIVNASLSKPIDSIPKKQIMVLNPGGSNNNYRLVVDFAAGTGKTGDNAARSATKNESVVAAPVKSSGKKIIVIDAGHGGKDPGCVGANGTREKDIVLKMARKLRDNLDDKYKIYLTRNKDIFLNLGTRSDIAEQKHADLFISLHANANPSRKVKGFSVYTLSKKASDAEAAKTAEAENAADKIAVDGFEKFEPDVRNALSSLQQQVVSESSVGFGNDIVRSTKSKGIQQQDMPLRYAPFAVLKSTIPSVLIELGHLSNKTEEKLLNTESHQDKLVAAIRGAIEKYEFLV